MKTKLALLKNQKILRIMAARGVAPEYVVILGDRKRNACPTCGSRHARVTDVIHHWYNEHFLKPAKAEEA